MTRWWSWTFGLCNHQPHSQVIPLDLHQVSTLQDEGEGALIPHPQNKEERLGGFAFKFFFVNRLFVVIE